MLKRKSIREKGKLGLSKLFVKMQPGDKVSLIRNLTFTQDFPKRFQGKTGTVLESRGISCVVKIYDGKRPKTLIVKRINLKKLSN
ncbi:50S ribosomal protein L21e [Nanoarchaeota archaeon]